jgi:Protein of unknown function (DUF732)
MKLSIAAPAVAALAAITLVTAPIASAGPEDNFLQVLSENGIKWPQGKDQAVIETGKAVCQDWSNGATFNQEVGDLKGATNWSDYQIGVFIGASTAAFCPQYKSKLPT